MSKNKEEYIFEKTPPPELSDEIIDETVVEEPDSEKLVRLFEASLKAALFLQIERIFSLFRQKRAQGETGYSEERVTRLFLEAVKRVIHGSERSTTKQDKEDPDNRRQY